MTSVRYPAVAGALYPDDPVELSEMVHQFLASGRQQSAGGCPQSRQSPIPAIAIPDRWRQKPSDC